MPRFDLAAEEEGWVQIKAKFDGVCVDCHEVCDAGEQVWWKRDEGVRHLGCSPPPPPAARNFCRGCMMMVRESLLVDGYCPGCRD